MRRIKYLLNIIIIVLISILLSGCWNYRDVDKSNIVIGLAVDSSLDKKGYLVSAEIVEVDTSGKQSKMYSKIVESEGETLLDAIRNMITIAGKKLYFSHIKVVIISKYIAQKGVTQIIDWLIADNEPRLELNLVVSKENTARELFSYYSLGEELHSLKLYEILKSQESLSKAPYTQCYKFVEQLSSEGKCGILPVATGVINNDKKTIDISGTAVFKKDKLVGFLSGTETKYLLFIRNQFKSGILPEIEYSENINYNVSLEIFKNSTKIKPTYIDGRVSIEVNINTTAGIAEHGSKGDYISKKGRDVLVSEAQKSLEANIEHLIRKVQSEYDADIFEFGKVIKIKMPSLWKNKILPNWDIIFKNLNTNIRSDIKIRGSGFKSKPINIGD